MPKWVVNQSPDVRVRSAALKGIEIPESLCAAGD